MKKFSYRCIVLLIFLVAGFAGAAHAQLVRGIVSEADGEPIIGATVVLTDNTSVGTITGLDGSFSLELPDAQNAVLSVSYVGFQTKEVPVNNQRSLVIVLEVADISLDEVVFIGYGTVKRRDLTGAVSSIGPKEIVLAPTNNIMEALQGRIAGLDITTPSGAIGSNPSVALRGVRSIYGNNDPLLVIDGVIMPTSTIVEDLVVNTGDNSTNMNVTNYLNQLNPADIESIDVLKDAASTAIYGSAGANGVILITTRKGQAGDAIVNFDSYFSLKGTPLFKHGMQGEEWLQYYKTAYKNANGADLIDISTLFGGNTYYLDAYNKGKWIDWVDEAVSNGRRATTQKYSLSVSAGGPKSQVYSSLSYTTEQGLMSIESSDQVVFRLNIDQNLFSWAKVGFFTNSTFQMNNTCSPVFQSSVGRLPLGDVYDEYGNLNYYYIGVDAGNGQLSPLADWRKDQYANEQKSVYVQPTAYLQIKPFKDLIFKSQLGGSHANVERGRYYGSQSITQSPHYVGYVAPYAEIYQQNEWSYIWDNILTYDKVFNEDHSITLTGLSSWNYRQISDLYTGSMGQELDAWLFYRMAAGNAFYANSNYKQTQQMSYAGRANYSYKGKYLATASVRYDGVSWLSEGRKWDYFPSMALAWRISDEAFMEDMEDWLSNLKLRLSYGKTGNAGGMTAYSTASGMFKYAQNISVDGPNSPAAGGMTQYTGTYGNAGIGWEKSYTWNVGLDFGLFGNRLEGSFEWYDTRTKDLLYMRAMPVTTGITGWGWTLATWQNLGETMNTGWEFSLNSRNIVRKDFNWTTSLDLAWQKDQILSLPGGDFRDNKLGWFFEGESINSVYAYKYLGIWQQDEAAEAQTYGCEPGAVKIETVEQDGDGGVHIYNANDMQVIGSYIPRVTAGLNNAFNYKNIDLSVYLMGRFGHLVEYSYYSGSASVTGNQPSGVDYWTPDNTDAYYFAPGLNYNPVASAAHFMDGDFIKVKNVTLGYTLPSSLTKKALINRMRIYATAYNPAVWTKSKQLKGIDPESSSSRYPLYKQFVFGLNLTF
jgi:TonB-linked SusC/RagA family outer membrane protein